ncbi:neither inactivation nor afterpotential protein C [Cryptotermes secundus]|nr:neither inactivation nor afterpotential protein C [Cryptotermes secundus]
MAETVSLPAHLEFSSLQDPGERYTLGDLLGSGVYSEVFEARDQENGGKRVAIKIQAVTPDTEEDLRNEYHILREFSCHPNLPDLYGIYLKKASSDSEHERVWFVMELCLGGPVRDLVRGLQEENRRMTEEHIAYILKEVVKVLVYLHENHVMHRDIKGSNILLTKDGEVKLVDFGLSRLLESTCDKRSTCLGSPGWMAPEVVASGLKEMDRTYDSRIDVWALGITAIELGDGKAPYQDMHPTRALFQIVKNPPPRLYRPANWSQQYNDFITECLEKNPEHRPYIMELLEHPFLAAVPENDFHLSTELKILAEDFANKGKSTRQTEVAVRNGCLKTGLSPEQEVMHLEDLAAMEKLDEDVILTELHERLKQGNYHTFVGDVLLVLTSNEQQPIYSDEFHAKYRFKDRSDNAPHIFSVADRAYQDMLHHQEPQYILLAGETLSGKTTNMLHLLRHLLFLGQGQNKTCDNVGKAMNIIHALGNAATPSNPNSTRHVLQLEIIFTQTGKVGSAVFWLYQLEKWRVTCQDK